jgi:hypothetical protein
MAKLARVLGGWLPRGSRLSEALGCASGPVLLVRDTTITSDASITDEGRIMISLALALALALGAACFSAGPNVMLVRPVKKAADRREVGQPVGVKTPLLGNAM